MATKKDKLAEQLLKEKYDQITSEQEDDPQEEDNQEEDQEEDEVEESEEEDQEEGQEEDEVDEERTFACPECGTQVPSKTEYCVNCEKEVEREEEDDSLSLDL